MFMHDREAEYFRSMLPASVAYCKAAGVPEFRLPKRIAFGAAMTHFQFEQLYRQAQAGYKPNGEQRFGKEYLDRAQRALDNDTMRDTLAKLSEPQQYFAVR
jgi:hypothetical protein